MEIEAKKLDTAILYLQRIAEGNNPVNNMPAEEDSILNNPNVIRCMYFVKEVLEEIKRNGGTIGKKSSKTAKEAFPIETLNTFVYQEDKSITKLVEQINSAVDENKYQKVTYKNIQVWLKSNGYLEERISEQLAKKYNAPTQKGEQIGISCELRTNMSGTHYMATIYGKTAQEFIVKNFEKILSGEGLAG